MKSRFINQIRAIVNMNDCSLFLVVKQRGPKRGVAQKLLKYEMGTGDYTKKQKLSKRLIEFIKKL